MGFLQKNRGFTLVEMLFIVAIISLLSSAVIFSVQAGKKKAADTQRVSDLSQLQIALRMYKDFTGAYPDLDLDEDTLNSTLSPYLTGEVRDPKSGTSGYGYFYVADSTECGGPILYAETTDTGRIKNWDSLCSGAAPSESETIYVVKL